MNRPTLLRMVAFTQGMTHEDGKLIALHHEARKLGISKRTLTRDMQILSDVGYVFEYDNATQMYWAFAPKDRIL